MLIGQSPFSGCDEDELFWSICNEKPVIPRFLSTEANAILLLVKIPKFQLKKSNLLILVVRKGRWQETGE